MAKCVQSRCMFDLLSTDYFFGGKLRLVQPRSGYRVSVDSCLLVYFVHRFKRIRHCVEVGTGSGIVSIGLLLAEAAERVTAVEIQKELADVARKNMELHGFEKRMMLFHEDIREFASSFKADDVDAVVMNPPFWAQNAGKHSPNEQKRIANHEICGTLDNWMESAARILGRKSRGRIYAIYPAKKFNRLVSALNNVGYNLLSICAVYSGININAEMVLIEAGTGNVDNVSILPSIILNDENGKPTEESNWILQGQFSKSLLELPDMRAPR